MESLLPAAHRLLPAASFRSRGFTLLEVLISLALVLMLVLGINQVFSLTSKTVSTGQVLSEAYRNDRAIQGTIYEDMRSAVIEGAPCFVIRSQQFYAWRNPEDQKGDVDGNVENFDIGNGNVDVPTYTVNARSHRQDRLGFFARNRYFRQTGTPGKMVETDTNGIPESSGEAWIVYGHLWLPNNNAQWFTGSNPKSTWPGGSNAVENPNNYYAAQWILGRAATLLIKTPLQDAFVEQTNDNKYTPMSSDFLYESRFDVTRTTIGDYRAKLDTNYQDAIANNQPFAYYKEVIKNHFQAQPIPERPLNSAGAAKAVPCFLAGCTQFIVEYAGDFITQHTAGTEANIGKPIVKGTYAAPYGTGNYSTPDGVIDFIYDQGTKQRKICWYGFPRDTNLDGSINVTVASPDVLPMTHRLNAGDSGATFRQPPHERDVVPAAIPAKSNPIYYAAWGPDTVTYPGTSIRYPKPKLIRFTITADDNANRISQGQTFEYVTEVQ